MKAENSQQLKQLQTRKYKLEIEVKELEREASESQKACSKARNKLDNIKKEISLLKEKEVIVTEHAVIRYLERVMGLDIDQVKKEILTTNLKCQLAMLNNGNGKYPIGNGCKAVIKDNTVVSVV